MNIAPIVLALSGLIISTYILWTKQNKTAPVCPLRSDCHAVIHSSHSKFLGIPVEILGIIYYGFVAVCYAFLATGNVPTEPLFYAVLTLASTIAFLFSIYLTVIQLFVLRQICTWCLTSAILSGLIFALALAQLQFDLIAILVEYKRLILILHLFGFMLGVGGATMLDIFFFKFLKDRKISQPEDNVLRTFSQIIWVGLAILILSGIGLYLPYADRLMESSKFLVKMIVVAVIAVNGAFLNIYIAPKLAGRSFAEHKGSRFNRIAFAAGAVSAVSWYTAFILGALRAVPLTFFQLLLIYICTLAVGVGLSQLYERSLRRKQ